MDHDRTDRNYPSRTRLEYAAAPDSTPNDSGQRRRNKAPILVALTALLVVAIVGTTYLVLQQLHDETATTTAHNTPGARAQRDSDARHDAPLKQRLGRQSRQLATVIHNFQWSFQNEDTCVVPAVMARPIRLASPQMAARRGASAIRPPAIERVYSRCRRATRLMWRLPVSMSRAMGN